MTFDMRAIYATSYERTSNIQTVTLQVKSGQTLTPVEDLPAFRSEVTTEDAREEPALLEGTSASFTLWKSTLGGTIPKKGDKVEEEAGTLWTCVRITVICSGEQYRMACVMDR